VVDDSLPGRAALRVVQEIRAVSTVPLILLTDPGNDDDMVRGLDLGADAYITKPFGLLALIARTKALLRRVRSDTEHTDDEFVCGDLIMDFQSRSVKLRGAPVKLTPTEYKVLYYLVRNAGRVTTREALSRLLWDDEPVPSGDHLKVFICRLRAKIEREAGPRLIVTERGRGYRFVVPEGAVRIFASR
jgi:DNA-binding response OmpR family regulator